MPRLLLVACVFLSLALLLTLAGIGLELLPEDFGVEWNGLPLSEYDLGDLAGGIILFGLLASLLAGIHLGRSSGGASGGRRRLSIAVLVAGLVPFALTALVVALLVALCSGGGCS